MHQPPTIVNIRQVCETARVTLRDLEVTGRSKSYWQRVWVGQSEVGHRALARLAWLLGTAPQVLVEYPDWPVPPPCTCPCHRQREG